MVYVVCNKFVFWLLLVIVGFVRLYTETSLVFSQSPVIQINCSSTRNGWITSSIYWRMWWPRLNGYAIVRNSVKANKNIIIYYLLTINAQTWRKLLKHSTNPADGVKYHLSYVPWMSEKECQWFFWTTPTTLDQLNATTSTKL